mmetsp:Transcript_65283/g.176434  ORF Transcript_65283/g.176434 Transcript_65283/m.176434 type:complete len:213 (-) Transcript_65283:2-640(-)
MAAVQSAMQAFGRFIFRSSSALLAYIMADALPILMASVYFSSALARSPSSMASTAACFAAPWASICSSVSSTSPAGPLSGKGSGSSGSLSGSSSSGSSGSSGSSSSSSSSCGAGGVGSTFFGPLGSELAGGDFGADAAGTFAPQLSRKSLKKFSFGSYTSVGSALSLLTSASRAARSRPSVIAAAAPGPQGGSAVSEGAAKASRSWLRRNGS